MENKDRCDSLVNVVQSTACMARYSLIIFACFLILGCTPLEMEDVSSNPKYAHIIGKKFKTLEDLWATGITLDANYKHQVDFVDLVPGVGYTGPEVLFRNTYKTGSILEVEKVLKTKIIFPSRTEYVVTEVNSSEYSNATLVTKVTEPIDNGNWGLDPSIYELLD